MPDVSDFYEIVAGTDMNTRPSRQHLCSKVNSSLRSNDRESAIRGPFRLYRGDLRSARSVRSGSTYLQGLGWIALVSRMMLYVD